MLKRRTFIFINIICRSEFSKSTGDDGEFFRDKCGRQNVKSRSEITVNLSYEYEDTSVKHQVARITDFDMYSANPR